MVRRVDRRMNALQTNRPTDTASYRGALAHLNSEEEKRILEVAEKKQHQLIRR